jgi:hypothetical protein
MKRPQVTVDEDVGKRVGIETMPLEVAGSLLACAIRGPTL